MIKLVLSDMDNTLLPFGEPHVTKRTVDAIHAIQEQGIDFGPASGRERGELASFFQNDASCYNTGVLCNGQKIYFNGQIVQEVYLDRAVIRKVEDVVLQTPHTALITYRPDTVGDWVGIGKEELSFMYERAFKVGGQWHERLPEYPVIKAGIVHMGSQDQLVAFQHQLKQLIPECDFANTVVHWLDVTPHGWSKADGVRCLAKSLNFSLDEVAVFGDAANDLAMLKLVPNSCVVANASNDARAVARYQVPASADDGVAWALEQIAEAGRIFNETGKEVLPRFMTDGSCLLHGNGQAGVGVGTTPDATIAACATATNLASGRE